jgi:hypothetical protein
VGGLAGHLFGGVATKTAASVAQQSGQATAQQAADRGRQATARKENLSSLFLTKGCKTSDLAYNPPAQVSTDPQASAPSGAAAQTPTPAATTSGAGPETAVTAISLPDLNPAEWFDGKMGGTFGEKTVMAFGRNNRVAIAGFRVVFVMHNETHAITRGSYLPGRDTGTSKA